MKQLSWAGAGPHEGHTITAIEQWPARLDGVTVDLATMAMSGGTLSSGRVRCTCGDEWNVGGWPTEVFDEMDRP